MLTLHTFPLLTNHVPYRGSRAPGTMGDDDGTDFSSYNQVTAAAPATYVDPLASGSAQAYGAPSPAATPVDQSVSTNANSILTQLIAPGSGAGVTTSSLITTLTNALGLTKPAATLPTGAPAPSTSGLSTQTMLLLGAAALGLFLIMRRR